MFCGFEVVVLDDDPDHIETLRKFGVKVFYGDAARLDLLITGPGQIHTRGMKKNARLISLTADGGGSVKSPLPTPQEWLFSLFQLNGIRA
jgi:voltage-gated potassium channel Kch